MTSRRDIAETYGFPLNGFVETPKRKRQDLTPLSTISPMFGAPSPVAGPSRSRVHPEITPVKRMKLQQTSTNLVLGNGDRPLTTKALTSRMGTIASPSRPSKSNFTLGQLPIALNSDANVFHRVERLPLGAIVPITTPLQNYEDISAMESDIRIDGIENDSDDERNLKPCHPKMTDMPSLSLQLSHLLAKQKSFLALFHSSTSKHQTSISTDPRAWSERSVSARYRFQLVSVATNYGHTSLFNALANSPTGQSHEDTILVAFLSESQGRDGGIHPNIVASTLHQGESRLISAMVWDPIQRLTLQTCDREVWLCTRYCLSVEERQPGRAIPGR